MTASYLRPDVVLEPLVGQYHAVPHTLSPLTAARILANRQLPLLRSFLKDPRPHEMAARTPALAGGAFFQLPASRGPELAVLLAHLESTGAAALRFDAALVAFEKMLLETAHGEALEPLYAQLTPELFGAVEPVYDLHHRATARVREAVLYRTPVHRERLQAVRAFISRGDVRPFYVTPRLREPGDVWLDVPFRSEALAALAQARFVAAEPATLAEALAVPAGDRDAFAALFTTTPPAPPPAGPSSGVRVRYYGHACLTVETQGVTLCTDPSVAYEGAAERRDFSALPARIDYALFTHAHPDHFSLEWLLALRSRIGTVVVPRSHETLIDPSLRRILKAAGFSDVVEVDDAESLPLGRGLTLHTLPFQGEHCDLDIRSKVVFLLQTPKSSALLLGDTNLLERESYEAVKGLVGTPTAIFAGLESEGAPITWGYGPLFSTEPPRKLAMSRRSNSANAERAWPLVEQLSPAQIHTYSMGLEPWVRHVMGIEVTPRSPQVLNALGLIEKARARGLRADLLSGRWETTLP